MKKLMKQKKTQTSIKKIKQLVTYTKDTNACVPPEVYVRHINYLLRKIEAREND